MDEATLNLLRLLSSFLTPLVILILGIIINRKLESTKHILAKEREWQNVWAEKVLDACDGYNTSTTEIVTGLYKLKEIHDNQQGNWENLLQEKLESVKSSMDKLQYLQWEIQN